MIPFALGIALGYAASAIWRGVREIKESRRTIPLSAPRAEMIVDRELTRGALYWAGREWV